MKAFCTLTCVFLPGPGGYSNGSQSEGGGKSKGRGGGGGGAPGYHPYQHRKLWRLQMTSLLIIDL